MTAADLTGDWYRSTEEERGGRLVFRGPAYDFPPVRAARSAMSLRPDGTAEFGEPGPADRAETTPGTWKREGDVLRLAGASRSDEYVIEKLEDGILVLAPR